MKLVFKSPFSDIFNVLKMSSFLKNTLKINDWPKVQNCFWNISARKYPSKMVQYSKRTFGCQFSNETDPNYGGFLFFEKKTVNIMQCFKVFLKDCTVVFACFFLDTAYNKVDMIFLFCLIYYVFSVKRKPISLKRSYIKFWFTLIFYQKRFF